MVLIKDKRIQELSGLACSHRYPGKAFAINDEDGAIYTIDLGTGQIVGAHLLQDVHTGARIHTTDTESLTLDLMGRLWIGDIGDNDASRSIITLLCVPEVLLGPSQQTTKVNASKYALRYPNGPVNAESLLFDPIKHYLTIATKQPGSGHAYRVPSHLSPEHVNYLTAFTAKTPAMLTDATYTKSGFEVLARSKNDKYNVWVLDRGFRMINKIPVRAMAQPEAISLDVSGTGFWIGSEGASSPLLHYPLAERYR